MKKTILELAIIDKNLGVYAVKSAFEDVLDNLKFSLDGVVKEFKEFNVDYNDCFFVNMIVYRTLKDKRKKAVISLFPLQFFDKDRRGKAVIYIKKNFYKNYELDFQTLKDIEKTLHFVGFKVEKIYL